MINNDYSDNLYVPGLAGNDKQGLGFPVGLPSSFSGSYTGKAGVSLGGRPVNRYFVFWSRRQKRGKDPVDKNFMTWVRYWQGWNRNLKSEIVRGRFHLSNSDQISS